MIEDTFYRPPVKSAQCNISVDKDPYSAIFLNYDDDDYYQGYGQIKEAFRALTNYDILKPNTSDNDFRSYNIGNDTGYNLYVFDIRYQKNLKSAQPVKVKFKSLENFPAVIYDYGLVLPNKMDSIRSNGQRYFDLI